MEGGVDGGSPGTGGEPGNRVGDGAREGATLADATVEISTGSTKGGANDNVDVVEGFSNPFHVAKWMEVEEKEGEELKVLREAIEEFFSVLIKVGKEVGGVLDGVFKGKNVVES